MCLSMSVDHTMLLEPPHLPLLGLLSKHAHALLGEVWWLVQRTA